MSTWRMNLITVTLGADLHCGDLALGFIARTHYYVPAHIPWYACIPPLVQRMGDRSPASYEQAESFLRGHLRFSPFFVLHDSKPLFPWAPDDLSTLERHYIASRHGIGLDYSQRSALEGHLFEMEYILGRTGKAATPTRLLGHLFWRPGSGNGLEITESGSLLGITIQDLVRESQWGGERSKGWGVLDAVALDQATSLFEDSGKADLSAAYPAIVWRKMERCPFPLLGEDAAVSGIHGALRPLSGRRHDSKLGSGQRAEKVVVTFEPGWHCPDSEVRLSLESPRYALLS